MRERHGFQRHAAALAGRRENQKYRGRTLSHYPACSARVFSAESCASCDWQSGTIAAHFGARRNDLEAQAALHLPAHFLQRLAEKFFDLAAAQADQMRVLLLEAALVIMLIAFEVQQIELVDQAAELSKA